jgi:lactate dehydrogenase-like 2-hydroxyacid dehydrogenase
VATSRGIPVTNVPDYCIDELADRGSTLILALTRGTSIAVDLFVGGGLKDVEAGTTESPGAERRGDRLVINEPAA